MVSKIIDALRGIGGYYDQYYQNLLMLILFGGILIYFFRKRLPKWLIRGSILLVIVIAIRLILFGNPLAWRAYNKVLRINDIGHRHADEVVLEQERFRWRRFDEIPDAYNVKYLAVGSSQTQNLYSALPENPVLMGKLHTFSIVGMMPLEMMLYRDFILQRNPRVVILYLSDIDLAKVPSMEGLLTAPVQDLKLWDIYEAMKPWRKMLYVPDHPVYGKPLEYILLQKLVGDQFPEYRYAYLFEGLLTKLSKRGQALRRVENTLEEMTDEEWMAQQLKILIEGEKGEGWIDLNVSLLEAFLGFCAENNIHVVIYGGQYHPDAIVGDNLTIHQMCIRVLEKLDAKHDHVDYIHHQDYITFTGEDFYDGYHVNREASRRFLSNFIPFLEEHIPELEKM